MAFYFFRSSGFGLMYLTLILIDFANFHLKFLQPLSLNSRRQNIFCLSSILVIFMGVAKSQEQVRCRVMVSTTRSYQGLCTSTMGNEALAKYYGVNREVLL